jgi:predicted RNase H-like nuclease
VQSSGEGAFVEHPKKTRDGERERMALLEREGIRFELDAERFRLGRKYVSRDDLVDAASMLTTARRIASGTALMSGSTVPDSRGLFMQIWA